MKEIIITKLFNGEELTGEEAAYVARALKDTSVKAPIPFDHEERNDIGKACGLSSEKLKALSVAFVDIQKNRGEEEKLSPSILVEELEKLIVVNDEHLRAVCLSFIVSQIQQQANPLARILGKILGKDLGEDQE